MLRNTTVTYLSVILVILLQTWKNSSRSTRGNIAMTVHISLKYVIKVFTIDLDSKDTGTANIKSKSAPIFDTN